MDPLSVLHLKFQNTLFYHKSSNWLGLSAREIRHLELLVGFAQAKTPEEREHFHGQLRTTTGSRIRQVKSSQHGLYGAWHTAVLRELLNAVSCPDTSEAAAKRLAPCFVPAVKVSDIQKSLEILRSQGLVDKTAVGRLVVSDKVISSGSEVPPEAVREILAQFYQLGLESLTRFPREERVCAGVTLSMSNTGYEQAQARLDLCRKEILEIARKDREPLSRIWQCNMQLFPVSKTLSGDIP